MTDTSPDALASVEVIQADRDAAAALELALGRVGSAFTAHITEGFEDDSPSVQAFGCLRRACPSRVSTPAGEVALIVRGVLARFHGTYWDAGARHDLATEIAAALSAPTSNAGGEAAALQPPPTPIADAEEQAGSAASSSPSDVDLYLEPEPAANQADAAGGSQAVGFDAGADLASVGLRQEPGSQEHDGSPVDRAGITYAQGERGQQLSCLTPAAERMREAAAQVALNPGFIEARDTEWDVGVNSAKRYIAAAIRALPLPSPAVSVDVEGLTFDEPARLRARKAITDRYYAGGKLVQMTPVKPAELVDLVIAALATDPSK